MRLCLEPLSLQFGCGSQLGLFGIPVLNWYRGIEAFRTVPYCAWLRPVFFFLHRHMTSPQLAATTLQLVLYGITSALKQMGMVKPLTLKHHCANGVTKHVWPRVETLPTLQNT